MCSKVVQNALHVDILLRVLFFMGVKLILNLEHMDWTVPGIVRKGGFLLTFRADWLTSIMKLHNTSSMTDHQYLLNRSEFLFLYHILLCNHLNKFMNSFIYVHPALPILAFVLADFLLLFTGLFLPRRQWLASQNTSVFLPD